MKKGYLDEVADEPAVVVPDPDVKDPGEAPVQLGVQDLDFITDDMALVLNEAGIINVADLVDWSREELIRLQGIGTRTVEKLLELI